MFPQDVVYTVGGPDNHGFVITEVYYDNPELIRGKLYHCIIYSFHKLEDDYTEILQVTQYSCIPLFQHYWPWTLVLHCCVPSY